MTIANYIAQEEAVEETVCLPAVPVQTSEVVDQDHDIVKDLDTLDNAVTAMESLLTIYSTCHRQSVQGLEPAAAKLMVISTENICNRLGISLKQEIPALEHFSSPHTTAQATRLSMETIGETISKIFSAFVEMMKNLISKIFQFFASVIDDAEQKRVEQYQRVIKEEVERLKKQGCKKSDGTSFINNQRLITAFSDPEKGIDDEVVKRVLTNAEDYCEFLIAAAEPVSQYFAEMITELKFFNSELNQRNYNTYLFGEKIDERVGLFLETKFNPQFQQMFDKSVKAKETFNKSLIKHCDATNIDGEIRSSGLLANGIRFAYYLQKSSHTLTCEQTHQQYDYKSEDDTIYKLPDIELANEINTKMTSLCSSMAKLSALVSQKHSRMEKEIKQLLSSALGGVQHAEKSIDPNDYTTLYVTVKIAMKLLTDVFEFYKDAYGSGLVAIKNTSDCGNMMSKEIVSRYQEIARNKAE